MLKSTTAKNIFSIVFGLAAGFSIVFVQLIIQYIIYPTPAGMDITDADATREFAALAPPIILILVIIFYSLATFAGGFVAATVAVNKRMTKAITVGGILIGFGAYNPFMMPHPVWTVFISLLVFIPCSYFGGYLGIKMTAKRKLKAEKA